MEKTATEMRGMRKKGGGSAKCRETAADREWKWITAGVGPQYKNIVSPLYREKRGRTININRFNKVKCNDKNSFHKQVYHGKV